MSADSEAGPSSDPADVPPVTPEKMQVPQAKRRYKREVEVPDGYSPDDGVSPGRRGRRGDPDLDEESTEDDLREEIRRLSARLLAATERRPTAAAGEPDARGAKYFRLERKASAPREPREPRDPREPSTALPETAAPVPLGRPREPRVWSGGEPADLGVWVFVGIGILALALVAFFLGRVSVRPTGVATSSPVVPPWSGAGVARLDQIFESAREGNFPAAVRDSLALQKQLGNRDDLKTYAAGLEARAGQSNDAEADLARQVDAPHQPREAAAIQFRLGFVYARRRTFDLAAASFESAAMADPFDPVAFYYWGEALRRTGKLPEAVDRFKQAILRVAPGQPESDSLAQCAALRIRLVQIEVGNDAEVKKALDAQLGQPVPSVYWLVTAVAYDLQHNDSSAAIAALQRTKVVAPPDIADSLLNDYLLRTLAGRNPELAGSFPDLTEARRAQLESRMPYFIDP